MKSKIRQIAVIGGRYAEKPVIDAAERIGELIAERDWQLICGGMGGVMRSACLGASSVGGITIGVLPGKKRGSANFYVQIPIATGIGVARNSIIAHSADAAIAVGGRYGTLSEIAYFLQLGKPVVTLFCDWSIDGVVASASPEEAVAIIEKKLGGK